jgi:outer membrane lipoprotein-sorting protein
LKKILLFSVLLLLSPQWTLAQEDAFRYLDSIERKYAGVRDYIAEVTVHFDIETFKAPDMQAKLYYKVPDKMKVESKRVLFFPREGGFFNPSLFKKEDFEIKFLERFTYDGVKAVKLKLTPKKIKRTIQEFVLTIDTDRNVIREMDVTQFDGRAMKVSIEYGKFDSFELPARILLKLDIPSFESEGVKEFDQLIQKPKRVTGTIEITYSNYKVNSGLSDNIFKETESSISRGSPEGKSR